MVLSESKLKKLANGHTIQLSHSDITGSGLDISKLSTQLQKKLHSAWKRNKGTRIKLTEDEVEGAGLSHLKKQFNKSIKKGTKVAKQVAKVATKAVKATNQSDTECFKSNERLFSKTTRLSKRCYSSVSKRYCWFRIYAPSINFRVGISTS